MIPKNFRKNMELTPKLEGLERREELAEDIIRKGTHLPRGVLLEDIDKEVIEFTKDKLSVIINGEEVPVLLITIQRWAEFSKTWEFTDEFKNIRIPFMTIVRQPDVQIGTNQNGLWNIPGTPTYTHVKVPTWNGNRVGMTLYKIPQPTSVDVNYDIRVFTGKMKDLNKFSVKIQKEFNSRQSYIWPNNHPQPLHLEDISDESTIDDFENRRFYVQDYNLLLKGYILDEDDFVIEPAIDRALVFNELMIKGLKPVHKFMCNEETNSVNFKVIVKPYAETFFDTRIDLNIRFTHLNIIKNVISVTFKVNNVNVNLPFTCEAGDILSVFCEKTTTKKSQFLINGYLL